MAPAKQSRGHKIPTSDWFSKKVWTSLDKVWTLIDQSDYWINPARDTPWTKKSRGHKIPTSDWFSKKVWTSLDKVWTLIDQSDYWINPARDTSWEALKRWIESTAPPQQPHERQFSSSKTDQKEKTLWQS